MITIQDLTNEMLNDPNISFEIKVGLLKEWITKLDNLMFTTILSSDELNSSYLDIKFLKTKLLNLKKEK